MRFALNWSRWSVQRTFAIHVCRHRHRRMPMDSTSFYLSSSRSHSSTIWPDEQHHHWHNIIISDGTIKVIARFSPSLSFVRPHVSSFRCHLFPVSNMYVCVCVAARMHRDSASTLTVLCVFDFRFHFTFTSYLCAVAALAGAHSVIWYSRFHWMCVASLDIRNVRNVNGLFAQRRESQRENGRRGRGQIVKTMPPSTNKRTNDRTCRPIAKWKYSRQLHSFGFISHENH